MFLWWQKWEFKNALKGSCGADPSVVTKCGTMDTTAATEVSKSDWQKSVWLCASLSLSICCNYAFRSWLAEYRSVCLLSHSSAGLSPQTAPSNYSLCYKAKHTDELGWKYPHHYHHRPLILQTAAVHSICTGTTLQWQQAQGAGSSACKFPKTEMRFCNQRNSMFLNKAASTCSCTTCRAKEQQCSVLSSSLWTLFQLQGNNQVSPWNIHTLLGLSGHCWTHSNIPYCWSRQRFPAHRTNDDSYHPCRESRVTI